MRTEIKSIQTNRSYNELCIAINRIIPVGMMNMLEVNPKSQDISDIFMDWFRAVLMVSAWRESEINDWLWFVRNKKNVYIINENQENVFDKFKDELFDFIFIHDYNLDILNKWKNKIVKDGFVGGDNCSLLPKNIKPIIIINKQYWVLRKE